MPQPIACYPSDQSALNVPTTAQIHVSRHADLSKLQMTTRGFCRSIGLDESAVFETVIAVTELAHRLFIEGARGGSIELIASPGKAGVELEVRAGSALVRTGRTAAHS